MSKLKKDRPNTFMKLLLARLKITQSDAARRLGWSRQRVQKLLREGAGFKFNNLLDIKEAFRIPDKLLNEILNEYLRQLSISRRRAIKDDTEP